jgi:septal ring factor EnvC (AmiA/AmiB activator)
MNTNQLISKIDSLKAELSELAKQVETAKQTAEETKEALAFARENLKQLQAQHKEAEQELCSLIVAYARY